MGVCGSLPLGVCGPTGVCDPFSGTDRSGVGDLLGILLPRDLSTSPSSRIGVRSPLSIGSGLNAYGPKRGGGMLGGVEVFPPVIVSVLVDVIIVVKAFLKERLLRLTLWWLKKER